MADTLETAASNSKQATFSNLVMASLMVAGSVRLGLVFHPILEKHSRFLLLPIVVLVASRFGAWLPGGWPPY